MLISFFLNLEGVVDISSVKIYFLIFLELESLLLSILINIVFFFNFICLISLSLFIIF